MSAWGVLSDRVLTAAEISARQIYWRSPRLVAWLERLRRHRLERPLPLVPIEALEERLAAISSGRSRLVLVHSSLDGIALRSGGREERANPLAAASAILRLLSRIVGADGTLAMPTHPRYAADPGFPGDDPSEVVDYDPARTPSKVGLLTELFRLRPDARRSLHPLSSLTCRGPLAQALLADNLNDRRPLPHGIDSGYYRICREDGLVLAIGAPLIKYASVFHVAEEVQDGEWPIPNFFRERRFRVAGTERAEWLVRERRPEFVRCFARWRLRRDWLREGILNESTVGGLRVDWANARDIFEFQLSRRGTTYPYVSPRWAGVS